MLSRRAFRWIAVTICIYCIYGCHQREPVIATISHRESITLREFKEAFSRGKAPETLRAVGVEALRIHLDRMIQDRIRILRAYEMDLDEDASVVSTTEPVKIRSLLDRLYQTEIVDKVVTESEIRQYYSHSGKELIVRKILFRVPAQADSVEEDSVMAAAESMVQALRSGADFSRMALDHSDDEVSARRGGRIGEWTWSTSPDPLRNVAFEMEAGEISDPVRDAKGYNILKVDRIRQQKRKPYAKARDEIRNLLIREKRTELSRRANVYLQEAMEARNVVWDEEALNAFAGRISGWGNLLRDSLLDSLNNLPSSEKERILVRMKQDDFRVREFARRIASSSPRYQLGNPEANVLKRIIEQYLMSDVLSDLARKKGLERDPAVKAAVRAHREQRMLALMNERIGKIDTDPTEMELRAFYEEHLESKYTDPAEITVQEIFIRDEETAVKVAGWAKAGRSFDRLVEDYSERPRSYKQNKGVIGPFRKGAWGTMGQAGFDLRVGEIAGPVPLERDRGFSIIKLLDRSSPEVKDFEVVRDLVRTHVLQDLREEGEAAWMTEQKKRYRVIIYEDVLKGAFRETE